MSSETPQEVMAQAKTSIINLNSQINIMKGLINLKAPQDPEIQGLKAELRIVEKQASVLSRGLEALVGIYNS